MKNQTKSNKDRKAAACPKASIDLSLAFWNAKRKPGACKSEWEDGDEDEEEKGEEEEAVEAE